MMDVGKRAMQTSQTALSTVSHNIANKGTEGFSRQRVEIQTTPPISNGEYRIGTGARTQSITRVNNSFIEKQLENEGSTLGKRESRAHSMARVEQVFNEQVESGLNKSLAQFFNAFRELSNSPENLSLRNYVAESADFLAKDFEKVSHQLIKIQEEADFEIRVHVDEINALTKEIAQLNKLIQTTEIGSHHANDERDRRDLLLKKLGEKINIKYSEGDNGAVVVTAGNSALLVSGESSRDLIVDKTPEREGKSEGNVDIFYKASDTGGLYRVTDQFKGGAIGGVLDIRDNFINGLREDLNALAYELSSQVNSAHTRGFDSYGNRGMHFFTPLDSKARAAENLKVNNKIMEDAAHIVAGAEPNAPADNRIANIISSLQFNRTMGNSEFTFDDYYNNMVGRVGITASRANSELESQKEVVDQLKNIRESISGVSLDEETTKMIEYQRSFDASARLIRTADEMMDTVLNIKR